MKMGKTKTWFYSTVAALGGFLFGFDTIVINGAERDIQSIWSLSGTMHGWVVSSALWGTVIGSLIGGRISDRIGRKRTLFSVGLLFFVSAVWSAFASGPWPMIVARFIGGLGVGISTHRTEWPQIAEWNNRESPNDFAINHRTIDGCAENLI